MDRIRIAATRVIGRRARQRVSIEAIERDPRVFGGAAVIARTKIPVFFIEDVYRTKADIGEVLSAYPRLSEADVFAALSYARVRPGAVERDRRRYLTMAADAHRD